MAGLGDMMKQAREMQQKVAQLQQELEAATVTGESGAGMVRVTMTGRHDVRDVEIDASLLSEDKAMLEDLLAAAVNDAVRRVERMNAERMAELTAGLPLPPGMKLF
jgi:DNA-binding YbaB/EbfC family protein